MARFPPLAPSAPFPVWVTVWVGGFSVQDLRRYKQKEGLMPQIQREEEAALSSVAQSTYRRPGFWGTPVYPPSGGASRAPGLPQAAAGTFAGVARTHFAPALSECSSTRWADRRMPPSRPCGPCVPVSGWRWRQCPCRGYLDSVGPRVGQRLSGPSKFRGRTPPGSPVSGPLGAFDFCTRIKGGGRKHPPPSHKAPQCGAFPAF